MADSPTINSHSPHSIPPVGASTAASAADVSNKRGFFDLPFEIRRAIYKEAGLLKKLSIEPLFNSARFKPGSVLRVSKAFNEEVAPLIYEDREFWFDGFYSSIKFINTIGSKNASYIRHLHVGAFEQRLSYYYPQVPGLTVFLKSMTDNCPNLRSFNVNYITLKNFSKHIGIPTNRTRGRGSFEDIKEISDAFPQLSNISYLRSRSLLCLASPDAVQDRRFYDGTIGGAIPKVSEYEPIDFEEEFKKYQRRVSTNARRRQRYAERRDKLLEASQE